jgi:hypothetical protein
MNISFSRRTLLHGVSGPQGEWNLSKEMEWSKEILMGMEQAVRHNP